MEAAVEMGPGSHLVSSAVPSENPSGQQSGRTDVLIHTILKIKCTQADETANLQDPGLFLARCLRTPLPRDSPPVRWCGRRSDRLLGLFVLEVFWDCPKTTRLHSSSRPRDFCPLGAGRRQCEIIDGSTNV